MADETGTGSTGLIMERSILIRKGRPTGGTKDYAIAIFMQGTVSIGWCLAVHLVPVVTSDFIHTGVLPLYQPLRKMFELEAVQPVTGQAAEQGK